MRRHQFLGCFVVLGAASIVAAPSIARAACVGNAPNGIPQTISGNEECDDGKPENGDGCSNQCTIEAGYACTSSFAEGAVQVRNNDYPGAKAIWVINQLQALQTENTEHGSIGLVGADQLDTEYGFKIGVKQGAGDDDFIGLVIGFKQGDTASANASYLLLDWKQIAQASGGSNAPAGMALSWVQGIPTANNLWGHAGAVKELGRAATFGATGWVKGRDYDFSVKLTPNSLIIKVDGVDQFNVTPADFAAYTPATFPTDGEIGYYTYSQPDASFELIRPRESVCKPVCGDNQIIGGETCDDGNPNGGDGCSVICKIEDGWACPVVGQPCVSTCGDGVRAVGAETCDDGNLVDGDGCSATCQLEPGYTCPTANAPCVTTCGDGVVAGAEQCEAGGTGAADCDVAACKWLDTDGDGLPDWLETLIGSNPNDNDTDEDGVPDGVEYGGPTQADGTGKYTGPLPAWGTPGNPRDTDGDGVFDLLDKDDDGDEIPTAQELGQGGWQAPLDTDGDQVPNYLDPDDDGDGVPTKDELGDGGWQNPADFNNDNIPNYLDPNYPNANSSSSGGSSGSSGTSSGGSSGSSGTSGHSSSGTSGNGGGDDDDDDGYAIGSLSGGSCAAAPGSDSSNWLIVGLGIALACCRPRRRR